jgi:hypothetical protein
MAVQKDVTSCNVADWPALIQPDNILKMTETSYNNAHLKKKIIKMLQSALEAET